jgi:hypothetical protein
MLKQALGFKIVLVLGICLSLFNSGAFAQDHDRGNNRGDDRGNIRADDRGNVRSDAGVQVSRDDRRDDRRDGRGGSHYYRDGRWYTHGWFGWEIPVPVLSVGVLIDSLPQSYTIVEVHGNTYYYGDNTYFRQLPQGGYTVVNVRL